VNGRVHRRTLPALRRVLALALTSAWMATAIAAGAAVTPSMHCHGLNMPCCPPSGANHARCAAAQCIDQIPQKSETGTRAPLLRAVAAMLPAAPRCGAAPLRELTSGLRCPTSVFRLKDDLRI